MCVCFCLYVSLCVCVSVCGAACRQSSGGQWCDCCLQVCRLLYEVMTKLAEQHSDKVFTIQGAPR